MTTEPRRFTVDGAPMRLDRYLALHCPDLTRSRVARLVRGGLGMVNGVPGRPSLGVRPGDCVELTVPPPTPMDLAPEDIPIDVVYEDDDLLAVDKPAGLTVHPAPGHPSHTLVNALLALRPNLSGIGGVVRPGIVHRLDKDTSGLMLVAKHDAAHHALSSQLQRRQVQKRYLALVWGCPQPAEGVVDAPIARHPVDRKRMAIVPAGGREAVTRYAALERFPDHTLVEARPVTGRTHQIRVHLASLGCPLVGDALYGVRPTTLVARHFLHAASLTFRQPTTGATVEVTAPLPSDLQSALDALRAASASTASAPSAASPASPVSGASPRSAARPVARRRRGA